MKDKELMKDIGYWVAEIQLNLFDKVKEYMEKNRLNQTQLAERLGISKGYLSQVLNGNFDHRLSKLVELSLAIEKIPKIDFIDREVQKKSTKAKKFIEKPDKRMLYQDCTKFSVEQGISLGLASDIHTPLLTESGHTKSGRWVFQTNDCLIED